MRAAVVVVAAGLLAACSGGGESTAKPSTPATSNTWPGGLEPVDDEPTAEETQAPLALGETWAWEMEGDEPASGTLAVLGYRQPVPNVWPPSEDGQDGEVWGSLEAKLCVDSGSFVAQQFGWSLAFEDGARVEVTGLNGGDFPRPEFPMDATVRAGDCVRGLMMFPVPRDQRPVRAVYEPDGIDVPVEWRLPGR